MSGTSLDGLDIALVEFEKAEEKWRYKILKSREIEYDELLVSGLSNSRELSYESLQTLDDKFGKFIAESVQNFICDSDTRKVDLISSHGHTVHHSPEEKNTVQIGNGKIIAEITGIPVVNDFRMPDVLLGGQGAPLVPVGDSLLFGSYDACLNLGGFSNISFDREGVRRAFDICPVNTVLNNFSQKLGYDYDRNGELAAKGCINEELLNQLNTLEFYKLEAPKSLGIEWVNEEIHPLIGTHRIGTNDMLRTWVEHAADQISMVLNENKIGTVLCTGGGTFNGFLLDRISKKTKAHIVFPDAETTKFKEALIFALLGLLRWRGEINVLSSVTGACKDHSSGKVHIPSLRL
jgi:anhydro-N-acetylmuramic acid kinase